MSDVLPTTTTDHVTVYLHCSFCSKNQQQVKKMVAGDGVNICNECVERCNDALSVPPKTPTVELALELLLAMPDTISLSGTLHVEQWDSIDRKYGEYETPFKKITPSVLSDLLDQHSKKFGYHVATIVIEAI